MIRALFLLVCSLAAALVARAEGSASASAAATPYEYFVIAPTTPPATGELRPAIVYLHGKRYFTETSLEAVREDSVVRGFAEKHRDLGAYLIVPHSRGRWSGPAFVAMLDGLVREQPVDPRAVSLFGYSAGASGAWDIALHAPERLAGIATLAGNPPSADESARLVPVAVWSWYGEKDYPKPLAQTRVLLERLSALNPETRFTLLPGINHHQLPGAVFPRRELYQWLAARRLPAIP